MGRTRLPKSYILYDKALEEYGALIERVKKEGKTHFSEIIVTCEPVSVVGTIFIKNSQVISHVELVAGSNSVLLPPPPLAESYVVLEADGWGEAIKIDIQNVRDPSSRILDVLSALESGAFSCKEKGRK
ncbi:MAG: hypothetical protein QW333_06335 [Fervidicoccaceae archaeon]